MSTPVQYDEGVHELDLLLQLDHHLLHSITDLVHLGVQACMLSAYSMSYFTWCGECQCDECHI